MSFTTPARHAKNEASMEIIAVTLGTELPDGWSACGLEDFSRADPNKKRQSDLVALVYKNCLEYIREHGDGSEMMQIYEWLQKPAEECETDEFILIRDMMREVMDKSE